jgi:predicted kinase/uncharacterized HAD superfamily protein
MVLMYGYTFVGKSSIAKKISKLNNTDIFHSAIIRKELGLTPKTREEADKFFDYRNNLREETDRIVYGKLVEKAQQCLRYNNVIIDAGNFFWWQRKNFYNIKGNHEVIIVKVICPDEIEIKRRFKERLKDFEVSPFNETPSMTVYEASKLITEPVEKDIFSPTIIEYNTLNNKSRLVQGENTSNVRKILDILNKKIVIAIDFDGIVTYPHKIKTECINAGLKKEGYEFRIVEELSSKKICMRTGVPLEIYKLGVKGETTEIENLPLQKGFIDNYNKIKKLNVKLYIVTARYDNMIEHIEKYLKYHNLVFDGIINTSETNKIFPLKNINADIFIDDNIEVFKEIIKEDKDFQNRCDLIFFRDIHNQEEKLLNGLIEVNSWNEIYNIVSKK